MTLSNIVLEHAQSHPHTIMLKEWVWSINHRHAEQKMHDLVSPFEKLKARTNQFFTDIYLHVLALLTASTDA